MSSEDGGILASEVENLDNRISSAVRNTLWSMFIGGVSAVLVVVVSAYRRVQREIRDTLRMAGNDVRSAFAEAGNAVISVNFTLEQMFIGVGLSGGVAAPIAVTTVVVVTMIVVASIAYGVVLIIKVTPSL